MEDNQTKDILRILDALGVESKQKETKSNESMSSTQSTYGDEFVPTDMAESVIKKARDESKLLNAIPTGQVVQMPTNPYQLPVEGADPTFYLTSEEPDVTGTAATTSKAGTERITLTASKFSASVYLTGELDEDARIAGGIRNYVEQKLATAYAELIDKAMINGDDETGATGNINKDDGAPTAGTYYLWGDGLVRHAFDGTDMTYNAGTLAASDFIEVRKLLGGKKGANPEKLLVIMEPETYYKTLQLAQVETAEKFSGATIENGVLTRIYGMPVIVNSDFGKAEADGKQSATSGNNTLGRFAIAYMPHLIFGWRRQMKMTVKYLDEYDQYRITAHTRFTMDMAEADSVALGYNITV